jgi:fructokinase
MNTDFFAFGEILWDCLPSGRHAGGAPFNVAAHLAQLGGSVAIISAVGQDALGDEILALAQAKGVETKWVSRARAELPTGTVQVTLDANANASYKIVQSVAWDEIEIPGEALEAVAKAQAFVFGTLAARSKFNRAQLKKLLALSGPMKFLDVNLRPPFDDVDLVLRLAGQVDVVKLNDQELANIITWLLGERFHDRMGEDQTLADACAAFAQSTGVIRICVTRGAAGAAFWDNGKLIVAPAPRVTVQDTVGAGDAFTAGLMMGLTRGRELREVLEFACRLGAYVASQAGATPKLPDEFRRGWES